MASNREELDRAFIDVRRPPFFTLDRETIKEYGSRLGATGIAVYTALSLLATEGEAFSFAAVCELTGIRDKRIVGNSVLDLEEIGVLKRTGSIIDMLK
jgi:hypothetical protein